MAKRKQERDFINIDVTSKPELKNELQREADAYSKEVGVEIPLARYALFLIEKGREVLAKNKLKK